LVLALVSSFRERPIDEKMLVFGEVGLSGEVRSVSQAAARVNEAAKLGFESVMLPQSSLRSIEKPPKGLKLIGVRTIAEAVDNI
jgi:DNA repair protein RadA/Sms